MSLTLSKVGDSDNVEGRLRTVKFDITLDASYPTGGYSIVPGDVGLKSFQGVDVLGVKGTIANSTGVLASFDLTNNKLVMTYPTGGATAPGALAAPVAAVAAGATPVASASAQPNIPLTAGIGKEVANATNLSTIITRIKFSGI